MCSADVCAGDCSGFAVRRSGFDADLAARGRHASGVHGEIHKELLELAFVGVDLAGVQRGADGDVDARAGDRFEELGHAAEHAVRAEHRGIAGLALAEAGELARDLLGGGGGLADFFGGGAGGGVVGELLQEALGLGADHGEQRGVFVHHAGGEARGGFHFLRLLQLLLLPAALADVAEAEDRADRCFA